MEAEHVRAEMSLCAMYHVLVITTHFTWIWSLGLTALNLEHFFLAPLVPEADETVSSCGRDNIAWRIVCSLQTRYTFIGIQNDAIGS